MKKNLKIPGVMAGLVMAAVIATVPAQNSQTGMNLQLERNLRMQYRRMWMKRRK